MSRKHRVMVVDDDDEIREALCDVLADEGYEVVGAGDGQQALDQLRRGPLPCLVFLDLMMPGVDGWEVLRQRSRDAALTHVPVVVITAAGKAAGTVVHVSRILHKPFPIEHVLDAAREFCVREFC